MVIRTANTIHRELFLTFDDGPDPLYTSKVLDCLDLHKAKATFFVIGRKANQNRERIFDIQKRGHTLASHSIDHNYRHFFSSQLSVSNWIKESTDHLQQIIGREVLGFRPPAGIVTPPLQKSAANLQIPLILWNRRFYDALWPWTQTKVQNSLRALTPGDIILLHDAQKQRNAGIFLKTLDFFLFSLKNLNLQVMNLQKNHIGEST